MSQSRGKRYDDKPRLNIKKVLATIIAVLVFIMFIISLRNLLKPEDKPVDVASVTTYFTVFANNKWGVIDNKGEVVIETNYDEMIVIPDNTKDLFICTYDANYENGEYKTRVLDKKGKEILKDFEQVEAIENYDANSIWYENQILKYKKDGKIGLIDFSGKEIVPAEYDKVYALPGVEKSIIIEKDGLCGLVSNSMGEVIIEAKYAEIQSLGTTYEHGYIVKNTDSYYGVITTDKREILECKYDKIDNVVSNEMFVVTEGGKNKIIKKDGSTVLENGFDDVVSIDGERIVIELGGKYGVIDLQGNNIIPCEYEKLSTAFENTYIAKKENKYGLINSDNSVKVDFKYNNMTYRKEPNFIEADGEDYKTDVISSTGETALAGVILSEVNTEKGYIRVRQDGDYKYYNFQFEEKKAQEVMPTNTLFLVKENGKYGYENKEGQRVVDCIYDDGTEQNSFGYVAVKQGDLWGSLKADGSVCLKPGVNLDNNLYINFIETWHIYENSYMNIYTK